MPYQHEDKSSSSAEERYPIVVMYKYFSIEERFRDLREQSA